MEIILRDLRESAAQTLDTNLATFDPRAPRDELVADGQATCLALHTIGAAMLLVDGMPQAFFLDLCRAAENWRRLHGHLRKRKLTPPPATYAAPLFGALAADEPALARGIALAVATDWQEGAEYEEDFHWVA